jgi:hypothetical protein
MSKITRSARDKECTIRIPGVCSGDNATTVHCHLPGGGVGAKRNDLFGARGCNLCHDAVDGRTEVAIHRGTLGMYFYEAVFRTQEQLINEGLVKI